MHIYKYSFRNIGPFSNVATIVDFESSKAQMNMMIGENGIGKSTTIKALKYGLYHDLAYSGDLKVDEIANDINKNGEIIVELNSRGKDWTIVTNFSPNKIKIYEGRGTDSEPLDKGGMPETKRFIRDQVLDIPFYIFDNILSIDVSEFQSLLTLNAEGTRKIRDRIFGFSIFNDMSADIKSKLNALVEQRKMGEHDLTRLEEQLTQLNADIESMKEQVKTGLKVDDIKLQLDKAITSKKLLGEEHVSLNDDLAQANNDFRWFSNKKNKVTITMLSDEKLEVEQKIKDLVTEQEQIDLQIEQIQQYAEVAALAKSVNEGTAKFKDQNAKLADLKTLYEKQAENVKSLNEQREIIVDHLDKLERDKKYKECGEVMELVEKHSQAKKEAEAEIKKIDDLMPDAKVEITAMSNELDARKKGICHQCNTKFDHTTDPDHKKHIEELEVKIKSLKDKLSEYEEGATKYRNEAHVAARKLEEANSRLAVLKSEIKKWADATEITDSTMEAIGKSIAAWVSKYKGTDAQADLEKIDKEITASKAKANEIKDSGNTLRGQLTSFRESIVKDQDKLKELKTKFKEAPTGNVEALKEKRTQVVTKRNELHKQQNSLDVQIQVTTTKIHEGVSEPKYTEDVADEKLGSIPQKMNEIKAQMDKLGNEIIGYEKSIEIANDAANLNLQSTHIKKQAREVEGQIKGKNKELADIKTSIERQEHLLEVIKRSKDEVLRVNIPYINHMVISTCKRIGVTQMLTFDDSFTPHIFRGNREVSFMSASLGQRKKMNFAVLIAITKFLKLRYGGLNIIFYDEMFSSIDEKGRPHMLEIIRQEIVENLNIHVWLTNHFFIPNSQFDNYIMVEAKSGFSMARKIDAGELLSLNQYTEKQAIEA